MTRLRSSRLTRAIAATAVVALAVLLLYGIARAVSWRVASSAGELRQIDRLLRDVSLAGFEWVGEGTKWQLDPACEGLVTLDAPARMTPEHWRFAIESKGVIRTRTRWPKSVPLLVAMRQPRWLGVSKITLQPEIPGGKEVSVGTLTPEGCGTAMWDREKHELCQEVGTLDPSMRAVEFACTVALRPGTWHKNQPFHSVGVRKAWSGVIRVPLEVVDTVPEAIEAIHDQRVTGAMREALDMHARCSEEYVPAGMLVYLWLRRADYPSLQDIAFGMTVDVLRDGHVVTSADVPIEPEVVAPGRSSNSPEGWAWIRGVNPTPLKDPSELKRWSLRISGDAEMALRDWDKPKYWAGEFIVPLAEVLRN